VKWDSIADLGIANVGRLAFRIAMYKQNIAGVKLDRMLDPISQFFRWFWQASKISPFSLNRCLGQMLN
jgi:hypothetical protein